MAHAYSTGPLENEVVFGSLSHTESKTAWTKVLNNNPCHTIRATILVFALNGTKTPIDSVTLTVRPMASAFHVSDVSSANQFEVEVGIWPRRAADDVLLGMFGKLENGALNPSHRLVHQEWTPVDDLSYPEDDAKVATSDRRIVKGADG